MEKRLGKVFIDANIINYAAVYQKHDVFAWINDLYETIYIHSAVLAELLTNSERAQQYINEGRWLLFDPLDQNCLPDDSRPIYEMYADMVKDGFDRLDQKKIKEGRSLKNTSNRGEIESLAAALFLSANIICSNDYDIKEVIFDENLAISPSEEDEPQLIIQDNVEDFCCLCVQYKIALKKEVRGFFKIAHANDKKLKQKLDLLNQRLEEI
ncbi:hypothetical protein AC623_20615 [Bacillus sp. FJAT-27231]|uniref:hypothetical protein n=1 Tax=Bacillus sp. FJAT-27231 TaxID=1679168 RepID=UPI000670F5BE|nr:hypothetical protein [Bacillus sp. FJAT-27231]KMY52541.1 hypothetical protein AC623_20615 [Bacillus sp. FJAT-27231]